MKTEEKLNTFSHTHTYIHSKDIISSRQRVEVIHSFTHAPAFTHQLFHLIMFLLNFSGSLKKKKEKKFPPAKGEYNGNKRRGENIRKHALAESLGSGIHTDSRKKEKKKQHSHAHTHKRVSGREKSAHFFLLFFFKL